MVRTQIQLTAEQAKALKRRAAEENRSLADLIRSSVDAYLAQHGRRSKQARYDRLLSIAGKYSSGKRDVSSRHDDYLADAYRG